MIRARSGFTLVEMAVAMLVGIIAMVVAFNAIILLVKGEKSTDRDASKAIVDARLMQTLLQDIRSATEVTETVPDKEYRVVRYVNAATGGKLEKKTVIWKLASDTKVTRLMDGATRPDEFDYAGLLNPQTPAVKFRLERVSDVRFPP